MRINSILFIGFLLLSTLIVAIGYLPVLQTQKVLEPLSTDVSFGLQNTFEIVNYSDEPNKMLYYEEAMSASIRTYIYTGDKKWLERYDSFESLFDLIIKSGIQTGDFKDREYLAVVSALTRETNELENDAIAFIKDDNQKMAITIIESVEYLTQKKLAKDELTNYVLRRESIYLNTIEQARSELDIIIDGATVILDATAKQVFLLTILTLLIAIGLGNLIYYAVSRPLKELSNSIEKITKGDLNTQLKRSDVYEIQSLVYSLDRILASLKLAVLSKGLSKESIGLGADKTPKKVKKTKSSKKAKKK